jgi:Osmosensitive K+ channel histidine kinase
MKKTGLRSRERITRVGKTLGIFVVMMLLAVVFNRLRLRQENTLMVFLTGILVIVVETGSYLCGFVTSVLCVGVFNYFFVEPYYTFYISDINNVISLAIFFLVSIFAGMIASRLQQQIYLTSQLEKTKAEIEKEKTRSMLLRSISHDLRSPLTGIAGSSSFLAENYDTIPREDAVALLEDMEKDANSLIRMVENLLNMTRIRDGRLVIRKKSEVLDDLVSDAVSRTVKKGSTHKVVLSPDSGILLVPVDGQLITQVFVNLLDNAVKYTPDGTLITIRTVLSDDGRNAVITVADNGPGIPAGSIDRVFENYVTGAESDKGRGLGLGLPICRTIMEAHGGTIGVHNEPEGGAFFTLTLPLADAEGPAGSVGQTQSNSRGVPV